MINDPETAINFCTQAIEVDQLNDVAYTKRAEAFELVGNNEEAKEDYLMVQRLLIEAGNLEEADRMGLIANKLMEEIIKIDDI